jgi:hypothetical protein
MNWVTLCASRLKVHLAPFKVKKVPIVKSVLSSKMLVEGEYFS